ncbi:peptidyl-prolyl cis-trans isomerase [bacterium]|nr:peptidyl-prolyl cis-trans isomerase [bacterium]
MKKILILSFLVLVGCAFAQADGKGIVATVNDDVIVTLNELMGEIRTLPQDQVSIATTKEGVTQVLDGIIRRKLLADNARMLQVDTVQVVKEAMNRSEDIVLADFLVMNIQANSQTEPVTEADAQQVYAQNESLFYSIPQVELKQIVAISEDEADKIEGELEKGKKFDDLIERYPGNPEGAKSGDIGFILQNQLSPAVVQIADGLTPGKWGGPIKTESGLHFIYLISRKPSEKLAFEDIKEDLIGRIGGLRAQNAVDGYIQSLIDESKVSIDNSVLKEAIVPVQSE